MIYSSKDMESRAVLDTAAKICAAARTAPKTRGMDGLVTCVLTGEDKSQLAAQMRKLADELDYAFFNRDADNVDASDAVVLFGMEEVRRGLDAGCQYCHFESCADCTEKDGLCAWDAIDIGIAIGAGTDIAIDSADIVLMHSDPADIPAALQLSRSVLRNIKQNLFWALIYNAVCIPVAAGVFSFAGFTLNPMIAAAAMSCSSVCVVSNALRLRSWKPRFSSDAAQQIAATQCDIEEEATDATASEQDIQAIDAGAPADKEIIMEKKLTVEGMMCPKCVAHVKKALEDVEGVSEAVVDLDAGTAVAKLADAVDDTVLVNAVVEAGYEVKGIE